MADQRERNAGGNGGAGVVASVMFIILGIFLWWAAHDAICHFLLFGIRVFTFPFSWIPGLRAGEVHDWAVQAAQPAYVKQIKFGMLEKVGGIAGRYWLVVLLPLVALAIRDALQTVTRRAAITYEITQFLTTQAKSWPAVVPWVHRDLTQNNKGRMAPLLHPNEVGLMYKFLVRTVRRRSDGTCIYEFDEEQARQAMIDQVGPRFSKLDDFKPYERALFAVFALRILRSKEKKRLEGQILLDKLNRSAATSKNGKVDPSVAEPEFQRVKELLAASPSSSLPSRTKAGLRRLKAAIKEHQWVSPLLVRMLVEARRFDGVLPPAEFLWVKEHSRALWAALNRAPVGDRLYFTGYSEGAGILNCFQAEKLAALMGGRLTNPYVEGAVRAFKESLYETGYIDTPVEKGSHDGH